MVIWPIAEGPWPERQRELDTSYYQIATSPFEGARAVRMLPSTHPSHRLHGHSFVGRIRMKLTESLIEEGKYDLDEAQLALEEQTRQLDYRYLNDVVEIPTDENIARWLIDGIGNERLDLVGVQSTPNQGVDLDSSGNAQLWRKFRFEAAHQLPYVRAGHKCGRMHGHGFEIIIHVQRDISNQQMGPDYNLIAAHWEPIARRITGKCLNDIPGLQNPTSEVIAQWIWEQLKPELRELSWVTVFETATAGCHFDGSTHKVWKELCFESAVSQARREGKVAAVLGHSYRVRLHCSGPINDQMGWVFDYGEIKEAFRPIYTILDHHNLDETVGSTAACPLGFLQWLCAKASLALPILGRIDLFETPTRGVVCAWNPENPGLPA